MTGFGDELYRKKPVTSQSNAMLPRLARLIIRVLIAAAILWAVISAMNPIAPLPFRNQELIMLIRVPIAVFIFIVYVGKTLYDTFFYERQP